MRLAWLCSGLVGRARAPWLRPTTSSEAGIRIVGDGASLVIRGEVDGVAHAPGRLVAGELRATSPTEGLVERFHTAGFSRVEDRWCPHLTEEQVESVAYRLRLHTLGGTSAEADYFARDYGSEGTAVLGVEGCCPTLLFAL